MNKEQIERLLARESLSMRLESGLVIQVSLEKEVVQVQEKPSDSLSLDEKISLFSCLFQGRSDVYAVRWESKAGKTGYSPVCENRWRSEVCRKPKVKCADCSHQAYARLSSKVFEAHLRGEITLGLYPLLPDSTCHFLAFDCDGKNWHEDSISIMKTMTDWELPGYRERSRSGNGAHIWIFFDCPISAKLARSLGTAILTRTMESRPELGLASYDRMFPNQDWMPEGGFGNLIALPLQKGPRLEGNSVFIDERGSPFLDQWAFLAGISRIKKEEIAKRVNESTKTSNLLGVENVSIDEDLEDKWSQIQQGINTDSNTQSDAASIFIRLDGETSIRLLDENGNLIPSSLKNRLVRLAAFQNPEFYQAQRLRLSTFNIPRVIGCAVEEDGWLKLPRGLEDDVESCLHETRFRHEKIDERTQGTPIEAKFIGTLRDDQKAIVDTTVLNDTGIICAPTGYGKTVLACAILAARGVNTLILVHRSQLMFQWRDQLQALLGLTKKEIGLFGKGKKKLTGKIDVATIQSLYREHKVDPMIKEYGQIIVDECHHVSAFSFEQVLRSAPARYVLGLTATPIRRDGLHPIMFMQCGPLRVRVRRNKDGAGHKQEVIWKDVASTLVTKEMSMSDLYSALTNDSSRTDLIADDIVKSLEEGRFPLVLTERKAHLEYLEKAISSRIEASIAVLYGGQAKRARDAMMEKIVSRKNARRVVLATGKLIGEGFDMPDLDTLFLALPISWRGTLQQYVGRLSRMTAEKTLVQVYDYRDQSHPILLRMAVKRQAGYKNLGFQ